METVLDTSIKKIHTNSIFKANGGQDEPSIVLCWGSRKENSFCYTNDTRRAFYKWRLHYESLWLVRGQNERKHLRIHIIHAFIKSLNLLIIYFNEILYILGIPN